MMSILRMRSFPFTLVLLSIISAAPSVSRARIIGHVLQSTKPPSTIVVYTLTDHSFMGPSFSFPSITPVPRGPAIEHKASNVVEVEISGRDDIATPSSSDPSISPSDPQPSALLLSSLTPVSTPSESPTGSSRGPTVPLSAVVGGAVGGGVVLVAFIAFIIVTRRQHGPRIEPFPLESDVEHQSREEGHRRRMSQHNRHPPLSDVPIIRPPAPKQNHLPSPRPLLQSGAKVHPLYDLKVTVSETSLHRTTTMPETPLGRTYSHNCDAVSVMSRESDWRRHRPLPRPPTSKPPPVPDIPRDLLTRRDDTMPVSSHMAAVAAHAHTQPSLAVPSQSLTSSAPLTSPISPLDIDIGDYSSGPGTSPPTFLPARRDSQLEPMSTPRRLPVPPPIMQSPPTPSVLTAHDSDGDAGAEAEAEMEMEASMHLNFDADGRPDSPSVAKMYKELLELQRQVARLREDIPTRHFGEAPPDYAESVVGSTCV